MRSQLFVSFPLALTVFSTLSAAVVTEYCAYNCGAGPAPIVQQTTLACSQCAAVGAYMLGNVCVNAPLTCFSAGCLKQNTVGCPGTA